VSRQARIWILAVIVAAVLVVASYRFGRSRVPAHPTLVTVGATVVADDNGTPDCIKPDPNRVTSDRDCQLLWVSQSLPRLTVGQRVQATYVDALVRGGEAFQGWVISPLGEPSG